MNTSAKRLLALSMLCASASLPGLALGALIDRGGGLIYDTDLDVTWLADANYAMTSGYDTDGVMTWQEAMDWAANLSYYDSVRDVTYSNWRLPITVQPDSSCSGQFNGGSSGPQGYGYNCAGEMGHLFYDELGGVAGQSILTTHNSNFDLFVNIQSSAYWSATEFAPIDTIAWVFGTANGYQGHDYMTAGHYAWAVMPGDVAAVPLPTAAWLFGSGLLGLVGVSRRRRDAVS